jgi:hypothetical protein
MALRRSAAPRALDALEALKGQFGREPARRIAALLEDLAKSRLSDAADLIRLHETALFLRAYPQSPRVLRLADQVLFSFAGRLRGAAREPFEDPEVSGIAGTGLSTNFSYEIATSLAARHGRAIQIDWENYAAPDRLGPVLARLLPLAREDWAVEAHADWRRWFESAGCTLRWLLERVSPETYDLLEIPLRWELGDSSAARSRTRIPRREIFYHAEPFLKRSDVSLAAEFAAPKIPVTRLPRSRARKILDLIVDTSSVRYRELYGFTHPDAAHVYHADLGRGLDFFFFGVPAEWRLPLRAYHAGMYFKNGVPVGYIEGLSLFERMEVGFNLYYTFREGETAWLYARLLKVFREQLGVTCYSIDPYQIGRDNEEAIQSGAFWFYRKLGFQPGSAEVARLAAREEEKIAADPGYRTPPATLRRLAATPLIYGGTLNSERVQEWARFEIRRVGFRTGRSDKLPWETAALVRAKRAAEETRYMRLLRGNRKLRRTILRLGSQ